MHIDKEHIIKTYEDIHNYLRLTNFNKNYFENIPIRFIIYSDDNPAISIDNIGILIPSSISSKYLANIDVIYTSYRKMYYTSINAFNKIYEPYSYEYETIMKKYKKYYLNNIVNFIEFARKIAYYMVKIYGTGLDHVYICIYKQYIYYTVKNTFLLYDFTLDSIYSRIVIYGYRMTYNNGKLYLPKKHDERFYNNLETLLELFKYIAIGISNNIYRETFLTLLYTFI